VAFPSKQGEEIEKKKVTQLNHPKVVRQKLDSKYLLTIEKTAPPKILEQENREFPRVSTRVEMEQFGKPEKNAPYPPRKAANRRCPRKEVSWYLSPKEKHVPTTNRGNVFCKNSMLDYSVSGVELCGRMTLSFSSSILKGSAFIFTRT
jgi:hypothetical protein